MAPASQRYAALASIFFALAIIAWLVFGHYTRRVHVAGQLVPASGLLSVASRNPGTITEVLVTEGQSVKPGDALVRISAARSSSAFGDTSEGIVAVLSADRARLEADIDTARRLNREQAAALHLQQEVAGRQIDAIDGQIVIQQSQIELQQTMLGKIDPLLAKGYISAFQVQQQRSQLLTAQADKKGLLRQRADATERLHQAETQLAQLPLQLEARISDIRAQLSTGKLSLGQAEADRSAVVRAPRPGRVTAVLVKPGQSAGAEQPLLAIDPGTGGLQARLLIASSSVGFITPGTPVVVRVQAYPYQKFGLLHGTVVQVSDSALSPQEAMTLLGQAQVDQEPMYRVDVTLAEQSVDARGRRRPLRAGMVVDADLMLDRRTLVEWLLEPLIGMAKRTGDDS